MGRHREAVVTGLGAVSAFGVGAGPLWAGMREGRSAIAPLRHPEAGRLKVQFAAQVPADFEASAHLDAKQLSVSDPATQYALIAAREAIAAAGVDFMEPGLATRAGCIIGTGAGGESTHDEQSRRIYAEGASRAHPLSIVRVMINAPASQISMAHGLRGPAFAVASACASSNHALALGVQLIRAGLADVMVCGGTEAALTYVALRSWEAMRVLADDACRPFSASRRGLVLGEGAAVFVLEERSRALARGARVLGRIAGVGMTADACDVVAPSIEGPRDAMRLALEDAGLAPEDIDYINAHGTGTMANDVNETRAIRACFGSHADALAVSSTKPMHGHALGAAGALELVAVLGALREGVLPPTLNLDAPDAGCDLDYVHDGARQARVRAALSNSFAFGGLNAVLAVTPR